MIKDLKGYKICNTEDYKYIFNKKTGYFARCGKTIEDDPIRAPSPEIADIEISTICNQGCSFCYKNNTCFGKNMDLYTFKQVLSKFPKNLCQIAFGVGDTEANPDLIPIIKYTRDCGIIPNITINGTGSNSILKELADNCGSIAVSYYGRRSEKCIKKLLDCGHTQVNIHSVLSKSNLLSCYEIADKIYTKKININAIVFLLLKPVGRAVLDDVVTYTDFYNLSNMCIDYQISFGFDSCSSPFALLALPANLHKYIEPCESMLFSIYCNVDGNIYPCSFAEQAGYKGVSILDNSLDEIWNSEETKDWVKSLSPNCLNCKNVKNCRICQLFPEIGCYK